MKRLITHLLFSVAALSLIVTTSTARSIDSRIRTIENNPVDSLPTSIAFNEGWTTAQESDLFATYYGIAGGDNQLVLTSSVLSKENVLTRRFTQYYKGYKVELSSLALASKSGNISFITGNIYHAPADAIATPTLTEEQALTHAVAAVGAERYIWQDASTEQSLKSFTGNPDTTNYPKGTLVWMEDMYSTAQDRKLHLAYAFNIYAVKPLGRDMVYVDAITGAVLFRNPIMKQLLGSGGSLYSGYLSFQASPSGSFNILKDLTRGSGINTYSCNNNGLFYGAYVTSTTSVFNNDPSIDAHWGAEKVYDYWLTMHGRNSFDNAGAAINSYVHYLVGYDNAMWDGTEMIYGDGTGIAAGGFSPLTAVDICAHEIGHAVCTHTANLVYSGESGAMNEGFSDIWGAVIEEYADPHETDAMPKSKWKIGEEIGSSPLRQLDNPNLHSQPGCYGGTYWYPVASCTPSAANDYCGVHTNSGVMNHWFYFLCQGGSGTNDLGNAYSVSGIGTERGAIIAYQTELVLASTANFAACRTASINVAITLYGLCSPEVIAVTKAWYAVGVGANYSGPIIASITGPSAVCAGSSVALSDATPAGTWSSGAPATATVVSTTGVVSGIAPGTVIISYAIAGGCAATKLVTVNTPVTMGSISGLSTICVGNSDLQSTTPTGGTWSSSTTSIATISSDYGVATGVAAGTTVISYTITNACGSFSATKIMSVNPAPVITGSSTICVGATLSLGSATPGGTWMSGNPPVAIVGSSTGIVTGMDPGTATIYYIITSGCQASKQITINSTSPIYVADIPTTGLIGWYPFNGNANNWFGTGKNGTVNGATLTTDRFGIPNAAYYFNGDSNNITIDTTFFNLGWSNFTISCWFNSDTLDNPHNYNRSQAIFNTIPHNGVELAFSWLMYHKYEMLMGSNPPSSGWNILFHGRSQQPSATHVWKHAAVVKKAGNIYTLFINGVRDTTYTGSTTGLTQYCKFIFGRTDPGVISEGFFGKLDDYGIWNQALTDSQVYRLYQGAPGNAQVCENGYLPLTNPQPGGTWSSSNSSIASINSTTGVVSGVTAGTATITYTYGAGCRATITVSVHPAPAAITGILGMCPGGSTTLASSTPGGAWSSNTTTVATVGSANGIVNGVAMGTSIISYTLPVTGCSATAVVTVSAIAAITGTATVCAGLTTTLSHAVAGGTWTSSNSSIATVGSTGIATGVAPGTATITYALSATCRATKIVTVIASPAAITGTGTTCVGGTTSLSSTTPGGTWSSSATAVATVGSTSGVVTGAGVGTATITYKVGSCYTTTVVTITPAVTAVTGTGTICIGATLTLSCTTPGGTWSSSATAVASVGSSSGVVTGASTGTATISYKIGTCYSTTVVTVTPLASPITGTTGICAGTSATLSNATPGGTWGSGNTGVALIGSTTGIVTGVALGTSMITYSVGSGCSAYIVVTVTSSPAVITGTASLCQGATSTLSASISGGSWISGNAAVATVGSSSGVVSAISPGTALITYSFGGGCNATTVVTVNPAPNNITGTLEVCAGSITTVYNTTPGGTWSSSNIFVANVTSSGIVTGISSGNTVISYTVPGGCYTTAVVTVDALPAPITGSSGTCEGLTATLSDITPGGVWSSSNPVIASISSSGVVTGNTAGVVTISYTLPTGCAATLTYNVNSAPGVITPHTVCAGFMQNLTSSSPGGTWSLTGSPMVATIHPLTGVITGYTPGTVTVTYTLGLGCSTNTVITVNGLPPAITGVAFICESASTTLADAVTGGTWTSSNVAIATVDPALGTVAGISSGIATITYTISTGCINIRHVTVNPLPAPISGPSTVCEFATATFSSATTGGAWTSGDLLVATVGLTSGVVTGASPGTATITYTSVPTGCARTKVITVNPSPGAISGSPYVCLGSPRTLSNYYPGGVWSSSNTSIAPVGAATGVVTGLAYGTAIISYTLPSYSCPALLTVTVSPVPNTYSVTGGGTYCAGGTGVHIGLTGSQGGVSYLLYYGASATGYLPGTGSALDFGLLTVGGTYTVLATSAITGCNANMAGSAIVIIAPSVTPSVSVTTPTGSSVCAGGPRTFSAAPVNGGTTPTYVWNVNGLTVGTGSAYTFIPATGDVVSVTMNSSAACAVPPTTTGTMSVTVIPAAVPVTSVNVDPGDTVCEFTLTTYTASSTYGGSAPVYTWMVNGAISGTGNTLTYIPDNGDVITVMLQSNYPCSLADSVYSGAVNMVVAPMILPHITIVPVGSLAVVEGQAVTLNTVVTDAGPNPAYQWKVNGVPVPGATNPTYTSTFNHYDSVTCLVTSDGVCHDITTFDWVFITVNPLGIMQAGIGGEVMLFPNPNKGTFTLRGTLATKSTEELTAEVTNILGQVVYTTRFEARNGRIDEQLQLSNTLANGMYMLNLHSATGNKVFHFVLEQ